MNDKFFFDTKLIIYCYTSTKLNKKDKVLSLLNNECYISTQVVNEFINVLLKEFIVLSNQVYNAVQEVSNNFIVHQNSLSTIISAIEIHEKYKFGFYDCLIVSSCLESKCNILFSENLSNNQIIDERLKNYQPI